MNQLDLQDKEFKNAVEVVMKHLNENYNPHSIIIINSTTAELFEGVKVHNTDKYVLD